MPETDRLVWRGAERHSCDAFHSTVPGAVTQPAIHGRRSGRDGAPRPL
jgi:hypothetical protein